MVTNHLQVMSTPWISHLLLIIDLNPHGAPNQRSKPFKNEREREEISLVFGGQTCPMRKNKMQHFHVIHMEVSNNYQYFKNFTNECCNRECTSCLCLSKKFMCLSMHVIQNVNPYTLKISYFSICQNLEPCAYIFNSKGQQV